MLASKTINDTCLMAAPKTSLTSCAGGRHNMPPPLWPWPLTLKVVPESRVKWATCVPIPAFLGLCSQLRPNVRDRQTGRGQGGGV